MTAGVMEVTVVRARGLKNTELFGKMDPYVVIQYKNEERRSTTGQRKRRTVLSRMQCCICIQGQGGHNPMWNENFKFEVEYKAGGEEQHKLLLKLMDHDTFTHDDHLGQATIYLEELFEEGVENGKAEIHAQKYRVVSSNQTYHGEIEVGVTFTINAGKGSMKGSMSVAHKHENGGHKKESLT
ncbi:16 kDa phloem protein 1-like [Andrographis paniculata]|uniref:16 kDa phloem protein 1-like n=1 Tax=Andrographis paniculata TaxID=175694 RepID=UPI0021E7E1F8|nr:16 kDa phloem protein 1-like [Andrographis paniculata]